MEDGNGHKNIVPCSWE